ncbi:MAG: helix-turn-helix transcriptional regulator [Chitinophagaceae bacterium]|nr:helix-turn-helix transcriptional regulator [Chitinophagaceae bacterium]
MMMKNNTARKYSSPIIEKITSEASAEETNRIENKMLFAARLDDLIKEKGWSKVFFAEKLGKKPSEITKWLSGTHNFTMDTLSDIAFVFDLSLPGLMEQKEVTVVNKYEVILVAHEVRSSIQYVTPFWQPPAKGAVITGAKSSQHLNVSA